MNTGSRLRTCAVLATAALMLTSCTGSTGTRHPVNPTTAAPQAANERLTVPAGFDNSRGHVLEEAGRAYAVAPKAGVVVDVHDASKDESFQPPRGGPSTPPPRPSKAPEGAIVIGRDARTGAVLWSSQPPDTLLKQASPELRVVDTDNGEYVLLVRRGTTPESGRVRAQRVVTIDAYPTAGSGNQVKPTAHFQRDVEGSEKDAVLRIGDTGVLVTPVGTRTEGRQTSILWNPVTGTSIDVDTTTTTTESCPDRPSCEVVTQVLASTRAGLLTQSSSAGTASGTLCENCMRTFAVSGRWSSKEVAPADHPMGVPLATTSTALVAVWWKRGRNPASGDPVVYTVHDLVTGGVLTSVQCTVFPDLLRKGKELPLIPTRSPNERYLAAGPLVADVSAGRAVCLGPDAKLKGVTFSTVTDRGLAFGTLEETEVDKRLKDMPPLGATLDIATGRTEVLPDATVAPFGPLIAGMALFRSPSDKTRDRIVLYAFAPDPRPSGPRP